MTSSSAATGASWPAGSTMLPMLGCACRQAGDRILVSLELPNTPEVWAGAGLLSGMPALFVPGAEAAASGVSSRAATGAARTDTPLADSLHAPEPRQRTTKASGSRTTTRSTAKGGPRTGKASGAGKTEAGASAANTETPATAEA